jgi:hypothetical protein
MTRRIARRLRALWLRREQSWAMGDLGVADHDELNALFARPPSEAERQFLATEDRILARGNPARLIEDALWAERFGRVV